MMVFLILRSHVINEGLKPSLYYEQVFIQTIYEHWV